MEGEIWKVLYVCLTILYVLKAEKESSSKVTFGEEIPKVNITEAENEGRNREGKNFFDWLGFTIDGNTDPYLLKVNSACREGDLSECFKSKALSSLDDFFQKESYTLNENVRVVQMPTAQLRQLQSEPYEFINEFKSEVPEWDGFVNFIMRKVEKFVKSVAVEVKIPDEILAEGRYSPRFIEDIASEIDILEDKKS
uniref:Uncharacterized protein n=1 Tax=Clastoptera arizonana TaxID=38151 RepID=A0A1B6EAD1_9HEMI